MSSRPAPGKMISIVFNLLGLVLLFIMPFLASGEWGWGLGWLYTGAMLGSFIISRVIAIRLHPGFARERVSAGAMGDTKSWDKWIVPLVALWLPLAAVGIAGLDERLRWSADLPGWVHALGLGLILIGYAGGTWAMAVNAFFSSHVRIQADRGQHVISTGPYAVVRHPGYSTGALAMLGIPLLLDSLWAFPPIILTLAGLILRTALEDRTLQAELPGYREYAQKVRHRLIPGIW